MILAAFLVGMALSGITLLLIRAEDGAAPDKFGSAVAMFCGWCAFAMLLAAGTYTMGIVLPTLLGAAVLVARFYNLGAYKPGSYNFGSYNFGDAMGALAQYKLPLGVGALLCSATAWIGILNLMEGIPNG